MREDVRGDSKRPALHANRHRRLREPKRQHKKLCENYGSWSPLMIMDNIGSVYIINCLRKVNSCVTTALYKGPTPNLLAGIILQVE